MWGIVTRRKGRMKMTLNSIAVRQSARVSLIEGGQGVRSHLNLLGIHVGDVLEVIERAPFRGPVLVQINGSRVALGRGVARRILLEELGESAATANGHE